MDWAAFLATFSQTHLVTLGPQNTKTRFFSFNFPVPFSPIFILPRDQRGFRTVFIQASSCSERFF
jgi:hypothetical protein